MWKLLSIFLFIIELINSFQIPNQLNSNQALNKVDLYFYNQQSTNDIKIEAINSKTNFNKSLPIKVIIHGFQANYQHISVIPIKNAYLSVGNVNIIMVDWSHGASFSYNVSRYLVAPVGKRIAEQLKKFIKKMNINQRNLHIIGHSLGAHISGNIGKYFNRQLTRITSLDPALPLFDTKTADSVTKDDALFVDVIHTGGGVLGQNNPSGTVDFYPNRGFTSQPGCKALDAITLGSCSHYRAPLLFAESIVLGDHFLASECSLAEIKNSIEQCKPKSNGRSLRNTVFMGENCPKNVEGIYYLETNPAPPFGKGKYLNN